MKYIEAEPGTAPAAVGCYSHATVSRAGVLYASGQIGLTPEGILAEGIEAQTHQALRNLGAVLLAGGCTFEDLLRTNIYIADLKFFKVVNSIYAEYVPEENPPARICVVAAPPVEGAFVEIAAEAEVPKMPAPVAAPTS